jgi:voltage-gated potassium channel
MRATAETPSTMWTQDESGRVHTPLEPAVLAATLALIPVLILEADASGAWLTFAWVANWLIWAVFAIELAMVLLAASRRRAALRAHWLDVAIVAVTVPLFGQFLSSLRLLRLARLLRVLRAVAIISRAVQAERRMTSAQTFRVVALLTLFIVVVAGAAQAAFDANEFASVWDGVWWAVVTVTTVGYGDLYPRDVEGRLIAIVVMLLGIGFLSVLTATVASRFIAKDSASEEILETLRLIEADVAELKARLPSAGQITSTPTQAIGSVAPAPSATRGDTDGRLAERA